MTGERDSSAKVDFARFSAEAVNETFGAWTLRDNKTLFTQTLLV